METPSATGRRDRKRNATRDALVAAALDLFEEKGFAATTVDEIAERADVAQRTFFRHFPTKEAVLFPDSEQGSHAFRSALAARPDGEPLLAGVVAALATSLSDTADEDHVLGARRRAIIQQEGVSGDSITWSSIVVGHQIIEEAVADHAGLAVTDDTVQMIASVSLLLMAQAVPEWYAAGSGSDLERILDERLRRLRAVLQG